MFPEVAYRMKAARAPRPARAAPAFRLEAAPVKAGPEYVDVLALPAEAEAAVPVAEYGDVPLEPVG